MAATGFSIDSGVVDHTLLLELSKYISGEWKNVARYLKLKEEDINRISSDYKHSIQEQAYQSFLLWKRREGKAAKSKVLAWALKQADRKDLADEVIKQQGESEDACWANVCSNTQRDDTTRDINFQNCTAPSPVQLVRSHHDKIMLYWLAPKVSGESVKYYQVFYKKSDEERGRLLKVAPRGRKNNFTLDNLEVATTYKICVQAFWEAETGKRSEVSMLSTLPSAPPGKPKAAHSVGKGVFLQWMKPPKISENLSGKGYIIKVQNITSENEFKIQSDAQNGEQITLFDLNPSSSYRFSAQAIFCEGESEESEFSDVLELEPNKSLDKMYKTTRKAFPSIRLLKHEETLLLRNERIRKHELGHADAEYDVLNKVIMVVGATGVGKTTLINAMVNYVFGVGWQDNFRFQVNDGNTSLKVQSEKKWMTSYVLHHQRHFQVPYTITVIDTPGFGDTYSIERDQEMQIRMFFTSHEKLGIDHIDAIALVTPSLPRLTTTQRYIFESILALFGKDMSENIFIFITFADVNRPPVLDTIQNAAIPYKKAFKFNNSALYARKGIHQQKLTGEDCFSSDSDEDYDYLNKKSWNMSQRSLAMFFQILSDTSSKTLDLTGKVLQERSKLETNLANINKYMCQGLAKKDELSYKADVLQQLAAGKQGATNYTYDVEKFVTIQQQVSLNLNEAQNSLICLKEIALKSDDFSTAEYVNIFAEAEKFINLRGCMDHVEQLIALQKQVNTPNQRDDPGYDSNQYSIHFHVPKIEWTHGKLAVIFGVGLLILYMILRKK